MEKLALKMQHEAKVRWRYEWPLKIKSSWNVQNLFSRRKQHVLKRWLRNVENLSDEGKRSGRDVVDFQVENKKGSDDLINCQEGEGDIPIFQVGKGEEMISTESSSQQGVLTDRKKVE
jgi:hypothetical protein